ncbi:subtype B tannase [Pasteurellaceae bacterium LIM206]|nr:subtype B tannase [Pasteurellaceae bacterium LIM206]
MKLTQISTAILSFGLATQVFAAPSAKQDPLANVPFANKTAQGYSLDFDSKAFKPAQTNLNGKTVKYRAVEKIVYVKHPVEPDYQTINFYVPEEYFHNGRVNGFTAETAPIFLPNSVGGYMPAKATTASEKGMDGKPSTIVTALSKGYVVASVGARGRTLKQGDTYTGKAPAVIVDLKAAVRYLHANDAKMPGDANKIISNGTSAGGAMSALLAASGDNADYQKYLKEAGAANASDTIFAASVYCPITNLEHADMAYEWEFNGLNDYSRMDMSKLNARTFNDRSESMPTIEGTLSQEQIALSDTLKAQFPAYLNSLNLKDEHGNALTLDKDGNGSFRDFVKSYLIASANKAVSTGTDLSDISWVTLKDGKVIDIDWHGYIHAKKRMKSPPAFDALDLSSGENDEFGSAHLQARHFTPYSLEHSTVKGSKIADVDIIKMLNAMNYVDNPKAAQHWRIRVGTSDYDTSHAISAMLSASLRMNGREVDYALPWGVPHSGDYDLDELFQWTDSISKK